MSDETRTDGYAHCNHSLKESLKVYYVVLCIIIEVLLFCLTFVHFGVYTVHLEMVLKCVYFGCVC